MGDNAVDSVIYVYGFQDLLKNDWIRIEIPKLLLDGGSSSSASLNFEVVENTAGEANGGYVTLYKSA